jgi:hypothetical protein
VKTVLSFSIPGAVLLLVAVWAYESLMQRRGRRRGTPLSTTYVNEVTAIFHGTKRIELDHRASTSLLREEDPQGAPPGFRVDLDRGIAVVRPDDSGHGTAEPRADRPHGTTADRG